MMANSFSVLDVAESQGRSSPVFLSSGGGVSMDLLSACFFLLAVYAFLMEPNVALFTLAFLGFAFVYRPARLSLPWVG
ncbi:hypothetical protein HY994_04460 [Candidatus Micrarchaeota archaeon]|nr:hypothetical protein [Candidatus Micrarchaeota archaeon]